MFMEQTDLKEISKIASDNLKAGKIILFNSSLGGIIAGDFKNNNAIERLLKLKKESTSELILLADDSNKLNFLLEDVPSIAYDILENQEQNKTVILFDAPLPSISSELLTQGSLPVLILEDQLIKNICNRGIKALAALITNDSLEELLHKVDYVVTLPHSSSLRIYKPTWISLKLNGEVKIIRK
jgi:L-threonylcarbamoyladenylate synthase